MSGECDKCSDHTLDCTCLVSTQDKQKNPSSMSDYISKFIEYFTTITKEQADFMEDILKWDDGKKAAFMLAKRIFDDEENEIEQI